MNQLPIFESIEQLFPLWKTARPIVENTLPRALRFEMTGKDTLGVSLDWAQAIVDLAPPEDTKAVRERINTAWGHASAVIDMQPFAVLYRKPATQESLHRADSILEHQVQGMLAAREPTPLQILAHLMGITPLYAILEIKGTDAITTEFNILDYPYPLPERTAASTLREQFEAAYQAACLARPIPRFDPTVFAKDHCGDYVNSLVQSAWWAWQASRKAMVVDLPRPFMSGYTESGNCPATDLYSFDDVKSAIEAAGGSVKP